MNLLYVRKQIDEPWWKRWPKTLRDWFKFHHREGFFRASLRSVANVKQIGVRQVQNWGSTRLNGFDAIVFNFQCADHLREESFAALKEFMESTHSKISSVPRILLITSASSLYMPEDTLSDYFQLIVKREPLKDLGKYPLRNQNRDKIRPTVISCPTVPANLLNYQQINAEDYGYSGVSRNYEHDVFFSGSHTSSLPNDYPVLRDHDVRKDVVTQLRDSKIEFYGGLQERNEPLPDELCFPSLKREIFYRTSRNSRINLALDGNGEFTYRHWELLRLCCFTISSPTVDQLWFPFEFIEGEHYVSYEDSDDLQEKIRFYLDNPTERNTIARQGRRLFETEYDFTKHGRYLAQEIQGIL